MSLNGLRVATPEQNSRQLPMDVIPSDQAAAIQVSKTLTPDMDADAIGGNVNLVTRTARAHRPFLNVTTAGGQNQLGGGALVNLGVNAGKRFGAAQKFGAMVGGTYYKSERAPQNFEGTWCAQSQNCGVGATLASLDVPSLWELRDYPQASRLRQGRMRRWTICSTTAAESFCARRSMRLPTMKSATARVSISSGPAAHAAPSSPLIPAW